MEPFVAALFVDADGAYAGIDFVDLWPESRDARQYTDYHPVVAHPPCQRWGAFAEINYARWGGEHNRPGNDGGCFQSALASVNRCGGVLEHPANSKAWAAYNLKKPEKGTWTKSGAGYVCEVYQSAYGHRANKKTWLYYYGLDEPFDLNWKKVVGTHQVGFPDARGKNKNKPTLNKKEANATPIGFRDVLLELALWSSGRLLSDVIQEIREEKQAFRRLLERGEG